MQGDIVDLRSLIGLLRRRLWPILVVVGICLGGASLALVALKPVYTATALVLVDPSKKNLLDPDQPPGASSSDSARVDSEVELVKAETVLLAVAQELQLASDPEFGARLGTRDALMAFLRLGDAALPTGEAALKQIIDRLRDAVGIDRRGSTFLIAVDARSERPELAARIANAVARNYIHQQLEAKVASTLASRDIIQARVTEASKAVAASENAFDGFVDANIDRLGEATGRTDFAALRNQIDLLARNRATTVSAVNTASVGLERRDWAAVARSLADEAVGRLERQRQALLHRLAGAVAEDDPAVDLRAQLAGIESQLESAATSAVSTLRQQLGADQQKAGTLRAQLRDAVLSSDLPPDILTSIYELQQNAELARRNYQTLLSRQNDLDTQAFLQVADSRLVAEATAPSSPSFPVPGTVLPIAAIVGVSIGVGVALLIENFIGGFTGVPQAAAILKLPVVAATPRQRVLKRDGLEAPSVADAMLLAPLSAYAESIRRIRVGIDQVLRRTRATASTEGEGAIIVVSSAAPGEGKTTMALSLARAYALSGHATLLVDCDLRKPSIHRQLGVEASGGLLEYLIGADQAFDLKSIMTVDLGSPAQVVLGSRRSDIATDQLVAGRTLTRILGVARQTFDVVILDTPPVGPVVDGLYLAGMADAILLVVKWSSTPQQDVRSAVSALVAAKLDSTPVLVALNQQDTNPRAYGGKDAGYYAEA